MDAFLQALKTNPYVHSEGENLVTFRKVLIQSLKVCIVELCGLRNSIHVISTRLCLSGSHMIQRVTELEG